MAIKLFNSYQVWWDSSAGVGYVWFTYSDGERQRTGIVAQDSSVLLSIFFETRSEYMGII
jgi:hypothetical protein